MGAMFSGQQPAQPALNRQHSVGAKLDHLFVPGLHGFNLGNKLVQLSAAPGALNPRNYGRAATYTSTNAASATVAGKSAYPFVLVWCGRFLSTANNWAGVTVARSGGSGDNHAIQVGSSTLVRYITRNNFSTTDTLTLAVPGGAVAGVDLVIVAQSLSATDHRIYCNGVMATSSTNSGTPAGAFDTIQLAISSLCNQDTYFAGWGTQALSDAEALAFSASRADANDIINRTRRRVLATTSGSSTFNVSVSEGITLSDADAGTGTFAPATAESVSLADTPAASGIFVSESAESVSLADVAAGAWSTPAALAEALALSESTDATTGPNVYDVDLTETLALVDVSTGEFPFVAPQFTGADAWPRKRDTLRQDVLDAIEALAPSPKLEREAKQAFKKAVDAPQAPAIGPALAQALKGASERVTAIVEQAIAQAQAQQRRARRRKQQQQLLLM